MVLSRDTRTEGYAFDFPEAPKTTLIGFNSAALNAAIGVVFVLEN
jgi:hypothetical protein